jgi:hypothetical protein
MTLYSYGLLGREILDAIDCNQNTMIENLLLDVLNDHLERSLDI